MERLKTDFRTKKEGEQKAIFEEFNLLVANGSMKTAATAYLRRKYNIQSDTTIVRIRKKYRADLLSKAIDAEGLFEALENILRPQ